MFSIGVFSKISFLMGLFLTIFIFVTKNNLGKNKCARYTLGGTTFIYSLLSLDTFTTANKFELPLLVWYSSFVLYSFIGFLFYKFSICLTEKLPREKKYLLLLVVYTVLKSIFFFSTVGVVDWATNFPNRIILHSFIIEFIISSVVNIYFLYRSSTLFKKVYLVVNLDKKKNVYFTWLHLLLKANVLLVVAILIEAVLALMNYELLPKLFKIEPVIYTLFFFVLAYSLMYYPVFTITGDYEVFPSKEKYKHSKLNDSSELFLKIDKLVKQEKLYLLPNLKLNTISKKLNTSVLYVSQAINENIQKSFTDYINIFRVEEAKQKLLEPTPDTIFAIAIDVGFNSKSAFYYAFKKLTNMTPTEFRRKNVKKSKLKN